MRANDITETIEGFQREVQRINEKAISNILISDEKSDEFEKFDGKMNSIKEAVLRTQGMEPGDYEYKVSKGTPPSKNVTTDSLKSELTFHKERLTKFRENLKTEKYKVVNPKENTIKYLNNTTRGLFTKSIKDLEELAEMF